MFSFRKVLNRLNLFSSKEVEEKGLVLVDHKANTLYDLNGSVIHFESEEDFFFDIQDDYDVEF